jgi:hypothetical protein
MKANQHLSVLGGSLAQIQRRALSIQRGLLILVSLLALAGLLTTAALGAPLQDPQSGEQANARIWTLERADAPQNFSNMGDRSLRLDSITTRLLWGRPPYARSMWDQLECHHSGRRLLRRPCTPALGKGNPRISCDTLKGPQYLVMMGPMAGPGLVSIVERPPALQRPASLINAQHGLPRRLADRPQLRLWRRWASGLRPQAPDAIQGVGRYTSIALAAPVGPRQLLRRGQPGLPVRSRYQRRLEVGP